MVFDGPAVFLVKNLLIFHSSPTSPQETTELLSGYAGQFFNVTGNSQAAFLDDIMKAHDKENQELLTKMVTDGAMYKFLEKAPDYSESQKEAERLFYGRLIPFAWQVSSDQQVPFIM